MQQNLRPEYDEKSEKIINNSHQTILPGLMTEHSALARRIEGSIAYRVYNSYIGNLANTKIFIEPRRLAECAKAWIGLQAFC